MGIESMKGFMEEAFSRLRDVFHGRDGNLLRRVEKVVGFRFALLLLQDQTMLTRSELISSCTGTAALSSQSGAFTLPSFKSFESYAA